MTHPAAELLRAIADGKQMEMLASDRWQSVSGDVALRALLSYPKDVRIARPMVTREVSYPEPLRVKPPMGGSYWTQFMQEASPKLLGWYEDAVDHRIFAAGMAFATEADAAEAHKALFGAQT
ncbi:MAG: hypothetical protein V4738_14345 [Pseudomonadota bacterium]